MRLVDERLSAFLAGERDRWARVNPDAASPIDAVSALVSAGGKRIRPAFCLTAYLAAGGGGAAGEVAVDAAVALELLHTCALIHDDIMDEATHRRGVLTTHVMHTAVHQDRGWLGDPRRFGESVAILAGDLALVYADSFMARVSSAVSRLWAELRAELIIGQYMDVHAAAQSMVNPQVSRWIAIVKSGQYTICRPMTVGAALGGRGDLSTVFAEFGTAIGQAFQLRDDLIGAFGDAEVTGKPAGLDLVQHKMTLLVTLASQRNKQVRELLRDRNPDAGRLRDLLLETGMRDEIEAVIEDLVAQGCRALDKAPIDETWRAELVTMAHQVAYRDT